MFNRLDGGSEVFYYVDNKSEYLYIVNKTISLMPWSHLHGKLTRKNRIRRFHEMEWDGAISGQVRGLRGNYGMYVAVTGSTWQHSNKTHVDPVTAK